MGGIGINAVQGTVAAGAEHIVAIDPVQFRRDKALEFGATHAVATSDEATALIYELTFGRMAAVCINTIGVGDGDQIGASLAIVGTQGRVVVTPACRRREAGRDERAGSHPLRETGT